MRAIVHVRSVAVKKKDCNCRAEHKVLFEMPSKQSSLSRE